MKLKRITALLCAAAMVGSFAGCGEKKEEADGGKLRIFFQDERKPDVDLVAKKVSEITKEKIGTEVEFVMYSAFEYADKLPMLLASNEQMDIGFDSMTMGFAERARMGAYWDITEALPNDAPELYNIFENKEFLKEVTVDGKIYAVPTLKEVGEQWAMLVDSDFLKEANLDYSEDKVYEYKSLEPILKALKDRNHLGFMIYKKGEHNPMYSLNYYDPIDSTYVVSKADKKTIQNYYMTPEFEEYAYIMRDWYNKGYIAGDVATLDDYENVNSDNAGAAYMSYAPLNETNYERVYEIDDMKVIKTTPVVMSNRSTCGSVFGIFEKSKNKEKALEFLQLWNTDPEIKNLITYGVEGVHYDMVGGKVQKREDASSKYFNQNWASGNVFISTLTTDEPDNKWELYKEFNKEAQIACTIGFYPDLTAVKDKVTACTAVENEFVGLLSCGAVDLKETLPKFRESMEKAGVNDVVAEIQKQYDEWKK